MIGGTEDVKTHDWFASMNFDDLYHKRVRRNLRCNSIWRRGFVRGDKVVKVGKFVNVAKLEKIDKLLSVEHFLQG